MQDLERYRLHRPVPLQVGCMTIQRTVVALSETEQGLQRMNPWALQT